eukprot:CAMPEP_0172422624 /NCGR_PEP_ID=MMETSP1064-20121228/8762_1 /TAXON_ID=202472 /ORGANISM="Aulacoseira subarctica , Strain CCAP 1002/5" /LENGTH=310 /DNA_ID=CAMNT_0013163569 /DNA_START=62 /DNA_END=994 /DNA_ORIENTATION=+
MVKLKKHDMSVVKAFFGHDEGYNDTTVSTAPAVSNTTNRAGTEKRRNLGVGATPKRDVREEEGAEDMKAQDSMKNMLRVIRGEKRSHQEEEIVNLHQLESDEDEEGRTSVIKVKEAVKCLTPPKKKGKKSKEKAQCSEINSNVIEPKPVIIADPPAVLSERFESLASYREGRREPDGIAGAFRRTKARSKQKNIRKDTRGHKKPSHLIPGRSDFDGRGLTTATRLFLGLPERAKLQEIRLQRKASDHNKGDASADLAVDNLLLDVGKLTGSSTEVNVLNTGEKQKLTDKGKSRKKVTKSKYKNLVQRKPI